MRPAIVDNVLKMLSCGLTVRGYAVFQGSNLECSHQKKVCFSCKSRFCPTCSKKLTDQWIGEQKATLPDTQWQHITSSKVEDFIKRLVQHVPDKSSRMIRYYGFLATRVRSKLLPKIYDLLDHPERKAIPIRFPALMKNSFGVDPLECILCKSRMVLTGIVPGKTLAELHMCHERLALGRPVLSSDFF